MPLVLRSIRLVLTRLQPEDAEAFFAYRRLPEVSRYQSFEPRTLADARLFISRLSQAPLGATEDWQQLSLRLAGSGTLVGDLGLRFQGEHAAQVELGFTLAPAFQGQGLATEAVRTALNHLFGELAVHRVTASVDPRNTPSVALLERLGFRQEAHHRESLWFKGEWVDDVVFAMLRSEWAP